MAPVPSTDDDAYEGYNSSPALNTSSGSLQLPRGQGNLAPAPFLVRDQARDGNCLFRSFSDQVYGTPQHHALLRNRCSQYLASERNYFEQFVAEPFDEFLARIQREGEWGDDVEIEALSEIFDCRVEIYASYTHTLMRTFHETCDAKWGRPVRLQYEGHSHYNSLAPRSGLVPIARSTDGAPGEIEAAAIARSRKRQEAGQRRPGAAEADVHETDREVLDESIRLSRMEFEHKSDAEMDQTLEKSRAEWEKSERKRMDEEVVDAILQQSVMEEEQKQLAVAMKESKEMIMQNKPEYGSLYGLIAPEAGMMHAENMPGASSSSANERDNRDTREYQYPESVYAVMSMGFPLEKCIQAYHLVGDNPEGILAYCCQTLGR
jgi:OTU domain-containing protein 5